MALTWPRLLPVLLVAGALAFANVPGFELVWDDTHLLRDNTVLAAGSLAQVFGSDFWLEGERSGYYRPLVTLTYLAESRAFGVHPAGYHVMNVLYHLAAALALVWVGALLLGHRLAAWLAGLVFALHPIHTESVAFVSGRTDVIAALGFLLALGCYLRARDHPGPGWTIGGPLAFAAALLSKEVAIVLPGLLLAYELTMARSREVRPPLLPGLLRRLLPFVLVAAGYLAVRHAVLGAVVHQSIDWVAMPARAVMAIQILGRYLRLLLVPYPPNPHYVLGSGAGWMPWDAAGAGLAILAAGGAALWAWRGNRLPLFLFAWLLLTALPTTPLFPVGAPQMAERFLYLPSAAFALLAGWAGWALLARMPTRPARLLAGTAMGLLLAGALVLTLHRNEDWRDAERLFSRMAEASPRSWLAPVNLGYMHLWRGELARAASEFQRALTLRPDLPPALMGLAVADSQLGKHAEAIRAGERARSLEPASEIWHLQLAAIYGNSGNHAAAASLFAEAARRNPRRVETRYQLALALHRSGRTAEARTALHDAETLSRTLRQPGTGWQQTAERVRATLAPENRP
jgi:tetratricopeptide (TPR) repeat protein